MGLSEVDGRGLERRRTVEDEAGRGGEAERECRTGRRCRDECLLRRGGLRETDTSLFLVREG